MGNVENQGGNEGNVRLVLSLFLDLRGDIKQQSSTIVV